MIDLDFAVVDAEATPFAAAPTLGLKLRIASNSVEPILAIALNIQLRIAATRRGYAAAEQSALLDLFGEPARWGQTLKSLLWTTLHVQVPRFHGQTIVDVPISCTYDFDVIATKYFEALADGEIPLELLFSGTTFYEADGKLQVEQISWDKEAQFGLPVSLWKEMIKRYFPNTAWLRIHKDTFDRLYRYKQRNAFPTWEAMLETLLEPAWTP